MDDVLDVPGLGVFLEVDVAELDDAEAEEGVGQVRYGDGAVRNLKLVPAMSGRVRGERRPEGGGADDEAAAGDGRAVIWISIGDAVRAGIVRHAP